MACNRKPNSPVAIINRLGIADYYCGLCGKPLLKMVSAMDSPLPPKCPHCGKTVDLKSRHEEAKPDAAINAGTHISNLKNDEKKEETNETDLCGA